MRWSILFAVPGRAGIRFLLCGTPSYSWRRLMKLLFAFHSSFPRLRCGSIFMSPVNMHGAEATTATFRGESAIACVVDRMNVLLVRWTQIRLQRCDQPQAFIGIHNKQKLMRLLLWPFLFVAAQIFDSVFQWLFVFIRWLPKSSRSFVPHDFPTIDDDARWPQARAGGNSFPFDPHKYQCAIQEFYRIPSKLCD